MRHMTVVWMMLLATLLCVAQGAEEPLARPAPPTAEIRGAAGTRTVYYWAFARDARGHSRYSEPAIVTNAPDALSAENASNGTLRFLAMLYVVLAQPALASRPLIMIEEPENGIYVGYMKQLLEIFEEAEDRPQLIFTSHSPYFVDLFENRLDSIFVMKKGEQHSAITQPDVAQVKKRLEEFPLGELHFREMLG